MDNGGDILRLCRLCLVKDDVNIPIFEEQGDIRQIFLKISSCLPVKVSREDKLPKKICDGCSYKLDMLYEFWNTTANAEKQLLSWLGEAGMNAKMADGTISAVAQQIKPVETFVKQEAIDPSDIHADDNDDDKSYMFQQKFAVEEAGPSATVTSNEEEPPPKRARRTAAVKAQIAMDPESDDDDDSGEPITKVEDESEESEGDDHEPPFVDVPSTSADDQPGPSGVGKDGVEAPVNTLGNISLTSNAKQISMAHITPAAKPRHRNSKTFYLLSYNNDLSMNPVLQPSILLKPEPNPSSNHNVMYYLKNSTQQNPITMVSPNAVFIQEPSFSAMPVEETIGKPIFAPGYKNPFDYSKYANYLELSKDLNIRPRRGENRRWRALPPVQHRTWDCVICYKKEKDKDSLMNHYEQHKREKDKLKNCTVSEEKESAKLERHTSDTLTDPKEGIDISTFCKVQFDDVPIQNNQIDSHENAHECHACKATFANEKAMSRHVCSAKLLECLCSVCGKKFKNQLTLRSHMTIHNGKMGYVCNVCGKSFRTSSLFRSHLRVHSGEKPYKCKTCGKCFTQRTSLVIHQRGHTGERPYPCEKCGKGYVSRSALNVHSKNCR